jgi:hypothetical protein
MNFVLKAKKIGVSAFEQNKSSVPCLNKELMELLEVAQNNLTPLLKSFSFGYTAAMLASGQTDKNLPSAIDFKKIKEASV